MYSELWEVCKLLLKMRKKNGDFHSLHKKWLCVKIASLQKKERRTVKDFIVFGLLIAAVWNDCISYKVRNSIIIMGLTAGFLFRIEECGVRGIVIWFLGVALPIVLFWMLFRYKMLGAGDIKLFSVIGGMYGLPVVINTIILAFLAGGVLSVIRLLQTGGFRNRLQYLAGFISSQCKERKIISYYQQERDGRTPVIHFTIAILIGFIGCQFGGISFWR